MSTDLVPIDDGCSMAVPEPSQLAETNLAAQVRVDPTGLYAAFLADSKKPATRRGRAQDIRDLARYLKVRSPELACLAFISGGRGACNSILTGYTADMLARELSPATYNRRLSTLKQLVELAQRYELVDWSIKPKGLRVETYRDTQGPGRSGWVLMHERAKREAKHTDQGKRDLAIIRLAYYHGMRRESITSLDVEHWNPDSGRLMVLLKRRYDRTPKNLCPKAIEALEQWLEARGRDDGPMFTRLDRGAGKRSRVRISGTSVYNLVVDLGKRAGLRAPVRPHGLRHQGATQVAELSNGNLLLVQAFLDHSDPKTSKKYIDQLKDEAGAAAKLLDDND